MRFDRYGQPQMVSYAGGPGADRLRALFVYGGTVTAAGESDSTSIPALTPAAKNLPPTANAGQLDGLVIQLHEDGLYASPMILGKNLAAELLVTVVGVQNARLPVTVVSTDPSRLLVNESSFSTGTRFTLSALAGDAVVDVVVSAPGLNPLHVPVTLLPSYLIGPSNPNIAMALNKTAEAEFKFAVFDPATGYPVLQALRLGVAPSISLISSAIGTAFLSIVPPPGFVTSTVNQTLVFVVN